MAKLPVFLVIDALTGLPNCVDPHAPLLLGAETRRWRAHAAEPCRLDAAALALLLPFLHVDDICTLSSTSRDMRRTLGHHEAWLALARGGLRGSIPAEAAPAAAALAVAAEARRHSASTEAGTTSFFRTQAAASFVRRFALTLRQVSDALEEAVDRSWGAPSASGTARLLRAGWEGPASPDLLLQLMRHAPGVAGLPLQWLALLALRNGQTPPRGELLSVGGGSCGCSAALPTDAGPRLLFGGLRLLTGQEVLAWLQQRRRGSDSGSRVGAPCLPVYPLSYAAALHAGGQLNLACLVPLTAVEGGVTQQLWVEAGPPLPPDASVEGADPPTSAAAAAGSTSDGINDGDDEALPMSCLLATLRGRIILAPASVVIAPSLLHFLRASAGGL